MTAKSPPIHEYANEGNVAGVLDEISRGTDVDAHDPVSGWTPLMEAVASRLAGVDLVRLLIQRGANVNALAGSRAQMATVLSLAVKAGNPQIVETLLDAGADIHYVLPYDYDILIHAAYGLGPQLAPILQLLIARGAKLDGMSTYSETALLVACGHGRFDAVGVLLAAGASATPLQWTPLMHAIALGTVQDVETHLKNGADLAARDCSSRTPWLLSLQVGEVSKAKLLLAAGANRPDRGHCEKPPLMYPITNGRTEMLRWLLSLGLDPNEADKFGQTPLMLAAEDGATECARMLVEAGADIHRVRNSEAAIRLAANLEIVRLLVSKGADLNDINDDMRARLTRLPFDGKIHAPRSDYLAQKRPRHGRTNPEKMNFSFWRSMITSGAGAYAAREHFDDADANLQDGPVWCFNRFGKSINELPDGRIIEIAGEHEDYYDPDFCIYNDVIVHHGDGTFDIYGYPKACFPPTDFHTATLIGKFIYVIGSLSYRGERTYGETPVYRLNTDSLEIEKVITSGESPGWISRHKATLIADNRIRISGGKVCALEGAVEDYKNNPGLYVLDLATLKWSRISKPNA